MATGQNIQQLSFTVGVDMEAINHQVGPLLLTTTKPYRMRRNSQPGFIARQINLGQRAVDGDECRARGTLGCLPAEILNMIFDRMTVRSFLEMKRVCKSIKALTEGSLVQTALRHISAAEPKSLSLFMRSKLGNFYNTSALDVFFEEMCFLCHGYGDGIFLPTMTRICLSCSEKSAETSCICMTTATDRYSLTENQIIEAGIPIITNAIPNGNMKLVPEILVKKYSLRIYGSMANIRSAFERNKRLKMSNYEIQYARWEMESENFEDWVQSMEFIWGEYCRRWPNHARTYYLAEKERLKKKPKIPRQAIFEADNTHTTSREASAKKYLTRKARVMNSLTGENERFCYCLGCRGNVLPAEYLLIGEGGSYADVKAARRPYLQSRGDLLQHQRTCAHLVPMRHEYHQRLVVAVRNAIEDDQVRAISDMAMEF